MITEIPVDPQIVFLGIIRYRVTTQIREFKPRFWEDGYGDPLLAGVAQSSGACLMTPDSFAGVLGWAKDRWGNLWAIYNFNMASVVVYKGINRAEYYPGLQVAQFDQLSQQGELPKPITDLRKFKL